MMTRKNKGPKGPSNWRAYFSAAVLIVLGLASSNVALVATGVIKAEQAIVEQAVE